MRSVRIYDNRFNLNEWCVIGGLCVGLLIVFILPRRFPRKRSIVHFMCGVTFGFLSDHVLSVMPVSFYDVNDSSKLQVMDFVSYLMYGPVSYLFFYVYDLLNVRPKFSPIYILTWAFVSTGFEAAAATVGIFHYQHGYSLRVSFVIYLMVESFWVLFYYLMQYAEELERNALHARGRL